MTTDAVFNEVQQSLSEPRKTCIADALSLCGSWASCLHLWSQLWS